MGGYKFRRGGSGIFSEEVILNFRNKEWKDWLGKERKKVLLIGKNMIFLKILILLK